MRKILQIINKNLGPDGFSDQEFKGSVYFQGENGLDIDKSEYIRLLDYFNNALKTSGGSVTPNDDLLVVFKHELSKIKDVNSVKTESNYYRSTIILDSGLMALCHEENSAVSKAVDLILSFSWDTIDAVELMENTSEDVFHFFRFHVKNHSGHHDININRFGTDSLSASQKILTMLMEIIEYKNTTINQHAELQSKIEKLFNEEDYEAGVEALDEFRKFYNINDLDLDDSSFYFFNKTFGLRSMGRLDEALVTIDEYIKLYEERGEIESYTYELKGELLFKQKKYVPAINCFAISEENYENQGYKKGVKAKKEEVYAKLKKKFLKVPYTERQLVFVTEDIYATRLNNLVVLKKNSLPSHIKFLEGHPLCNEVYIGHPHKQDFYLPLRSYTEILFLERVEEFVYLLQGLGATHLKASKGPNNEVDLKIEKEQDFNPTQAPYIPNSLVWYHSEVNWQQLVDERINKSVVTYSEIISSLQTAQLSSQNITDLNAELKHLLPKAGVKVSKKHTFSKADFKVLEWMFKVDFEDSSKLPEPPNSEAQSGLSHSDSQSDVYQLNLEKYEEEVLFMIEDDGKIDVSERKILNRKIKKLGLTKADALAIEDKVLVSNYSENEKQYIEELKDMVEDGKISEKERKILNRYALKFNVSPKTQKEIDAKFIDL
ncbi:tetratricopeptide repeat protein [Formosa algae]|uniref:Tetratricopeptide (TPR) repeat protein n=1 Tax=Formosa algae TaxID=225843 RepID=A0A9X0YIV6_9FLAO|nr:hypothetical protein [Formosa algae]MBP1839895.1 tetratricopeptide (TPR) repeat protein [Formosa algae]MDQ0335494.1 tetratricopeptide (TPR) repeat protein [Formosa algae]OEI81800.1 hypothetical protein AST99_02655 [Formosa algae]